MFLFLQVKFTGFEQKSEFYPREIFVDRKKKYESIYNYFHLDDNRAISLPKECFPGTERNFPPQPFPCFKLDGLSDELPDCWFSSTN